MKSLLGIDLGGTRIKFRAFDPEGGAILGEWISDTRDGEKEGELPAFAWEIRRRLNEITDSLGEPPEAVGLASPGLANASAEQIDFMPGRLSGLEGLNWATFLEMPGRVRVLNDGHAALMGELWQGAARGMRDVFLLTLGTGVGGAILSGGRLLRGHLGRAGHLGHISLDYRGKGDICGTPGSLEDLVGYCTLVERSEGEFLTTPDLVSAAEAGNQDARRVWSESVRALAAGVASLINVLDPQAVLIGGGIANVGPPLFDLLALELDHMEWRPANHRVLILPTALGDMAGTYGAAWFARHPERYLSTLPTVT